MKLSACHLVVFLLTTRVIAKAPNSTSIELGDSCKSDSDCDVIRHSLCEDNKCTCYSSYPINYKNFYCLQESQLNGLCVVRDQCRKPDGTFIEHSSCQSNVCICEAKYKPAKTNGVLTHCQLNQHERKYVGEKCEVNEECHAIPHAVCQHRCKCPDDYPIGLNLITCLPVSKLNESCVSSKQCKKADGTEDHYAKCRDGVCECDSGFRAEYVDGLPVHCQPNAYLGETNTKDKIDVTMIIVLTSLSIMFVVVCFVLQMFSRARFADNRSIFNTPNARLMNISILTPSENSKKKKKKKRKPGSAGSRRSNTASRLGSPCPSITGGPAEEGRRPSTAVGQKSNAKEVTIEMNSAA